MLGLFDKTPCLKTRELTWHGHLAAARRLRPSVNP